MGGARTTRLAFFEYSHELNLQALGEPTRRRRPRLSLLGVRRHDRAEIKARCSRPDRERAGSRGSVDFRNVQATIVALYKCPILRHLLFRFGETGGARAFLRGLAPRSRWPILVRGDAGPAHQVGITCAGLRGARRRAGAERRVRRDVQGRARPGGVGDVPGSRSDPAGWWEGRFTTDDVHCVVHVYVRSTTPSSRPRTRSARSRSSAGSPSWSRARTAGTLDGRSLGGAKLHFGYTDGISHPDVCWDDVPDRPAQVDFRHFLLGYATPEHSSAPRERPRRRARARQHLRRVPLGLPGRRDVQPLPERRRARGSSPICRRRCRGAAGGEADGPLARRDAARALAGPPGPGAGRPATTSATRARIPTAHRCPFSAHIRVMNPRDQALDPVAREGCPCRSAAVCRTARRSTGTDDDGVDRGLIGLFLCADIRRQIYTLTGWIKRNDFSPVFDANRRASRTRSSATARSPAPAPPSRSPARARSRGCPTSCTPRAPLFLLYPSRSTLDQLSTGS